MSGAGTWADVQRPDPDEDRTPMTRTELAMLWDGLGRWLASHPAGQGQGTARRGATNLRILLDVELAERFGS